MTTDTKFTTRLPADLKAWIEARTILTDQSMNAVIVSMVREFMDNDPLTALCIREDKGRYIVASAFTGETFGAFFMKEAAEGQARSALLAVGANPANVIHQAEREAA